MGVVSRKSVTVAEKSFGYPSGAITTSNRSSRRTHPVPPTGAKPPCGTATPGIRSPYSALARWDRTTPRKARCITWGRSRRSVTVPRKICTSRSAVQHAALTASRQVERRRPYSHIVGAGSAIPFRANQPAKTCASMSAKSSGYLPITTEPAAPATQNASPTHAHVLREVRNRQSSRRTLFPFFPPSVKSVPLGMKSEGMGAAQQQADAEERQQHDDVSCGGRAHLESLRPSRPPVLGGNELEVGQGGEVDPHDDGPDLLGRPDPVRPPRVVRPDPAANHPRGKGGEAVEGRLPGGTVDRIPAGPQVDAPQCQPRGKEAVPEERQPHVGGEPRRVERRVQGGQPLVEQRRPGLRQQHQDRERRPGRFGLLPPAEEQPRERAAEGEDGEGFEEARHRGVAGEAPAEGEEQGVQRDARRQGRLPRCRWPDGAEAESRLRGVRREGEPEKDQLGAFQGGRKRLRSKGSGTMLPRSFYYNDAAGGAGHSFGWRGHSVPASPVSPKGVPSGRVSPAWSGMAASGRRSRA